MNKRIRELAEKVGVMPWDDSFDEIERFAELIVRDVLDEVCKTGAITKKGLVIKSVLKYYGVKP
jgi:hypothetical protein